ncbi:MAG: hypothetical protein DRJ10_10405, partial [Bacteroidetes bacterium]
MKKICLAIIVTTLISISGFSQNEKQKVIFIYSFTKYISWPAGSNQGDFIIGVLASPTMSKELKIIASKRKVGMRSIKILDFASAGSMRDCHIVYVPKSRAGDLGNVIEKYKQKAVVVVADAPGSVQKGAAINFIVVG